MNLKNEKLTIYFFLAVSVLIFFIFGLYHLAKFETTDEHLWKYARIKQYWQALAEKDWEKTYINDKPGVTVALFSGAALLFEAEPEKHFVRDSKATGGDLFLAYENAKTERINFLFRFPVIFIATLSLFLFFWLARIAFKSEWLALFAVMFIAFNPILLGMSQIANPDSYFWIFSGLAVFAFLARLKTGEKKFLALCAVFSGFAFLSKYTALALFVFYFLALAAKIIFDNFNSTEEKQDILARSLADIFVILVFSVLIFSVFLPAVFVNPELLLKGVSQFKGVSNFLIALAAAFATYVVFKLKFAFTKNFLEFISKKRKFFLLGACLLFLLIVVPLMANVWIGQKYAPLDEMRDKAYASEPKRFHFGTLLKDNSFFEKNAKLMLMETYPFIFSLSPLTLFFIAYLIFRSFKDKLDNYASAALMAVFLFFIFYFTTTVLARVVSSVRYSIVLYPLFSLLAAIGIWEAAKKAAAMMKIATRKTMLVASTLVLILGVSTLWIIRPFYFSYANFFLPKKFTIHHSWGHGFYQAAEYLNSLPEAQNIVIWSNTNTICPFFNGHCLKSRKINLNVVKPDYFVVSRRGQLKTSRFFELLNSPTPEKDSNYYLKKIKNDYEWSLFINGRPENFVKIVKFEY